MDRHLRQLEVTALRGDVPTLDQDVDLTSETRGGPKGLVATEEMRCASTGIGNQEGKVVADTELLAMHGWLAPDGSLYACALKTHTALAIKLGYRHESAIEKAGYVKLANLRWLVQPRYRERELTTEQWGAIESWYTRNGFPAAHFLKLMAEA